MICPNCGKESDTVEHRQLNTMYNDDKLNYMDSCQECYDEVYHYYADLWDDIYADQMQSYQNALQNYNGRC